MKYVLSAVLKQLSPELFRFSVWKSTLLVLWKGKERTRCSPYKIYQAIISSNTFLSKLPDMLFLFLYSTLLPFPGFCLTSQHVFCYFLLASKFCFLHLKKSTIIGYFNSHFPQMHWFFLSITLFSYSVSLSLWGLYFAFPHPLLPLYNQI